jgi:hypothetical protein
MITPYNNHLFLGRKRSLTPNTYTVWANATLSPVSFLNSVAKLLKTHHQFTKFIKRHLLPSGPSFPALASGGKGTTSVCMALISANNQAKTQSQHNFKAHNMKALLNCNPNRQPFTKLRDPMAFGGVVDLQLIGSPLLVDYAVLTLSRKQLLKSALGAIGLDQTKTLFNNCLVGALIFIQKRVFFMHCSELKQSAHLQGKTHAVVCNLVRSRLNLFKLKAVRLKAVRLARNKLNSLLENQL